MTSVADPDGYWHALTITCPEYEDIEAILEMLKTRGFVENDWCSLNRHRDGAHVDWGPCEPPGSPRPYRWEVD